MADQLCYPDPSYLTPQPWEGSKSRNRMTLKSPSIVKEDTDNQRNWDFEKTAYLVTCLIFKTKPQINTLMKKNHNGEKSYYFFFFLGNHIYMCNVLWKLKAFLPLKYENMQVFDYICKDSIKSFLNIIFILLFSFNQKEINSPKTIYGSLLKSLCS